jgi:hypothetical protein
MKDFLHIVERKSLWLKVLGEINNHQIWLLRTRETNEHTDANILIASGFHGEEKAGPLGVLKWLEDCDTEIFKKVDLTFLPVVNPIGFNRGIRYNTWGEKNNCGFCHKIDKPSKEGKILLKNIKDLTRFAKDGFLSLHEDVTEKNFYVYSYEDVNEPSRMAYELRDLEAKFFKPIKDGVKVNEETDPDAYAKDGIVHKLCDGSFEDSLMHKGIRAMVTETPGKCRISRRIEATKAIIDKFIELSLEMRRS